MEYKFEELPKNEQDILAQIYGRQFTDNSGYNPQRISRVEDLSDEEKNFFGNDNFMSSNLLVQKLYKIRGNIAPIRFNLAVKNLVDKTEELRTNYCQTGSRTLKIIFEQRRNLPEVVYRNLENVADIDTMLKNIIEADMRQVFDLRHESLVRFSVFHTAEEEYAILVTVAKLIEDSFEIKNLFREAMNLELLPTAGKKSKKFSAAMSETMQNYWEKILADMPGTPSLPYSKTAGGHYTQKAYRAMIPADIMSELREKAKSNKMMLMAIFETAWAFLLQEFNTSRDVAFAALVPGKSDESFNMIPVRMKTEIQKTLRENVDNQFKQLIVSQPYAGAQIAESQRKNFDHFLSFNDFLTEEKLYSKVKAESDGTLVLRNSWNVRSSKLGLYFHYSDNLTSVSILYDKNKFQENFGEHISQRYVLILQQILTDWNLSCDEFFNRLSNRLKAETVDEKDLAVYMRQFISQLELLHGSHSGTLQRLLKVAKIATYFEGDRISGEEMEKNIFFVAEGKIARNLETSDGWYNTLDIMKANGLVNEIILLPKHKTKMSAEILTEQAILVSIPLTDIKVLLREDSGIESKFLFHALGEMEKYQRLWIQS